MPALIRSWRNPTMASITAGRIRAGVLVSTVSFGFDMLLAILPTLLSQSVTVLRRFKMASSGVIDLILVTTMTIGPMTGWTCSLIQDQTSAALSLIQPQMPPPPSPPASELPKLFLDPVPRSGQGVADRLGPIPEVRR